MIDSDYTIEQYTTSWLVKLKINLDVVGGPPCVVRRGWVVGCEGEAGED